MERALTIAYTGLEFRNRPSSPLCASAVKIPLHLVPLMPRW